MECKQCKQGKQSCKVERPNTKQIKQTDGPRVQTARQTDRDSVQTDKQTDRQTEQDRQKGGFAFDQVLETYGVSRLWQTESPTSLMHLPGRGTLSSPTSSATIHSFLLVRIMRRNAGDFLRLLQSVQTTTCVAAQSRLVHGRPSMSDSFR